MNMVGENTLCRSATGLALAVAFVTCPPCANAAPIAVAAPAGQTAVPEPADGAEQAVPPVAEVIQSLGRQRQAIRSLRALFLLEMQEDDKRQADYAAATRKASGQTSEIPYYELTPNRIFSYRWEVKGERWRDEYRQFYPSMPSPGHYPFDFDICDGEKLYHYDDLWGQGEISTPDAHRDDDSIGSLDDNIYYVWCESQSLQQGFAAGAKFEFAGRETVRGDECLKYISFGVNKYNGWRTTFWVCPAKGMALLKTQDETFHLDPKNGALLNDGDCFVHTFQNLREVQKGLFLPMETTREYYSVQALKAHWEITETLTMSDLEVNPNLPDSIFEGRFPPGTSVSDVTLASPPMIGLNPHEATLRMKKNTAPVAELPEDFSVSPPTAN